VTSITVRGALLPQGPGPCVMDQEHPMPFEKRLKLAAVTFAVLWTALMWWMRAPLDAAGVVSLVVTGAVTGILWYWLYGKWYRWYFRAR
jgi:hypothetical protein